jgi:hypothetical protein
MRNLLKPLPWTTDWEARWQESRAVCGLLSCTAQKSVWHRMWRHNEGARLQGIFYCRPQCLETALIGQLLRLEAQAPSVLPPNRIPLGLLMVARGRLSYEQVISALAAQQAARSGKIGEWFEKLGFASEQEVTAALGLQWGCPVASSVDLVDIPPIAQIPLAMLETFHMLPLHYVPASKTLYLAFGERVDHAALYAIEKILDCRTQPCVAGRKAIAQGLDRMRQQPRPSEVEFGPMRDPSEMGRVCGSYMARLKAEDARVGRVGPLIWLRANVRASHMNLLFRVRTDETHLPSAFNLPPGRGILTVSPAPPVVSA